MMAAGFGESERLRDGVDYTVSHRRPPIPSPTHSATHSTAHSTASNPGPAFLDPRYIGIALTPHDSRVTIAESTRESEQARSASALGSAADGGVSREKEGRSRSDSHRDRGRRPSLSSIFSRRSNSNLRQQSKADQHKQTAYTADDSAPPVPRTLIAAAEQRAAEIRNTRGSHDSPAEGNAKMLRKSSKHKQKAAQQQAEAARQASLLPREPPHLPDLPSLNPTFATDSADRPDSVAIFNTAYTHSTAPRPTANFSRPGALTPEVSMFHSSSPAYRTGGGLPYSSSPLGPRVPTASGEYVPVDHDRTESMTNRGRYSYANSTTSVNAVNSPRRVRRRKDPTPFNLLVVGAKNCGKTSLISFIKHSLALPKHKQASDYQPDSQTEGNRSSFTSHYLETEIDRERVGLTMWDSAGLEKNIVDLQLREMATFVESKFEDTFVEEQKVMRSPGAKDTHIHCVLLVLDPSRLDTTIANSAAFQKNGSHSGSLDDDLDLQVMRALWGKTTVIPIVSKADTLTSAHMSFLKRAVWQALKGASLDPLEALELEDDELADEEEDEEEANGEISSVEGDALPAPKARKHNRLSSFSAAANGHDHDDETPYLPMSTLSPDLYDLPPYVPAHKASNADKVGRRFPWGFADPYNPQHCDFTRLRDSIFSEWRSDLRELSRSKWYENWRTSRLKNIPGSRQRLKGGVTPVAAVPKEGRMMSQSSRQFSAPTNSTSSQAGTTTSSVPRSVSVASNTTAATSNAAHPSGMATVSENGGKNDVSGAMQTGTVRGGTYRSVNTYQ